MIVLQLQYNTCWTQDRELPIAMFVDRILPETGQTENSPTESLILEMKHLGFPENANRWATAGWLIGILILVYYNSIGTG